MHSIETRQKFVELRASNGVAAGVSPASEPGVSPGDANPSPKKHKPYWLNGHYYENPEYPEHLARAMFGTSGLGSANHKRILGI